MAALTSFFHVHSTDLTLTFAYSLRSTLFHLAIKFRAVISTAQQLLDMATILPTTGEDDGASSDQEVVNVYVQHGHDGERIPLGMVSGCSQASFKKLREQLSEQLDPSDLPQDPFNFVPGEGAMPVAIRQEGSIKVSAKNVTLRVKKRRKSVIEKLAVENFQAITDARNLPLKEISSMILHACFATLFPCALIQLVYQYIWQISLQAENGMVLLNARIKAILTVCAVATMYMGYVAFGYALVRQQAFQFPSFAWLVIGFFAHSSFGYITKSADEDMAWTQIVYFALIIVIPIIYAASLQHHAPRGVRLFMPALSVIFPGYAYFMLLIRTGITEIVKNAKADPERGLWILVVFPLVREFGYFVTRRACHALKVPNTDAKHLVLAFYLFPISWINRFLFTGMDTWSGLIVVVMSQSLIEIILRQTHVARDKWVYQYLRCKGKKAADAKFNNETYMTDHCRHLLLEHYGEYVSIVGAPLLIILYDKKRFFFDLGYFENQPIDVFMLFVSCLLQVCAEFTVDVLCVYVERIHGIDIMKEWRRKPREFTFICISFTLFGILVLMDSFTRLPCVVNRNGIGNITFCDVCYHNITYSVQRAYCDTWLNETNYGETVGFHNASSYGF